MDAYGADHDRTGRRHPTPPTLKFQRSITRAFAHPALT
jgi:hypothetical protein